VNPTLDLGGLDRTLEGLRRLKDPDATPLMLSWMRILATDNRQGILAGLDADGVPMAPVRYRPKGPPKRPRKAKFQGFGPYSSGLHGNLSSAEYRQLGGPPLAPRGPYSRVITNYHTDYARLRVGYWQVTFWWEDVVSVKGNPFLRYHFEGMGRLPRRDLRGIRPTGQVKVAQALQAWGRDTIRQAFG
jgi:hypothetical protein